MHKKFSGRNILTFVFSKQDVLRLHESYGEYLSHFKNFAITNEAYVNLKLVGIVPLSYESYFQENRSEELNNLAGRWSKNWYKDFDIKFSYKGINILTLFELSLHNYFAKKLYQYSAISELIRKEKPDVIVIGQEQTGFKSYLASNFETQTPVIKNLAKQNNIEIKFIGQKWIFIPNIFKVAIQLLLVPNINLSFIYSKNVDYLFLGHHYHLQNILELLRFLNKKNKNLLIVGKLGNAKTMLTQEKIDSLDLKENIHIFDNFPLKIRSLAVLTRLKRKTLEKYFEVGGESIYDILKPKIFSLLVYDCVKHINIIRLADNLINEVKPKVLIGISTDSSIQSFIKVAQSKNIPILEIQHGFTVGSDSKYFIANKLAVWGKISRDIYAKEIIKNNLVITGWPAFEIYKKRILPVRKIPFKPTITFLAQDPEGMSLLFSKNTQRTNFELFFDGITKLKRQVNIIVRLHPRADRSVVECAAKKYNLNFKFSDNREALTALLDRTDIVVGQDTSATLDAIITHKPVIYLPSMRWPAEFVGGSGAVFEVNNPKNLSKAINVIMRAGVTPKMLSAQKVFIEDYCNFSQNSVKNISGLIYEIEKNTL